MNLKALPFGGVFCLFQVCQFGFYVFSASMLNAIEHQSLK
jgi:hypothetical protein